MSCLLLKVEYRPEYQARMCEVEVMAGVRLQQALAEAKALGEKLECGVQFEFDDNQAWIFPTMDVLEQATWLQDLWCRRQHWWEEERA